MRIMTKDGDHDFISKRLLMMKILMMLMIMVMMMMMMMIMEGTDMAES